MHKYTKKKKEKPVKSYAEEKKILNWFERAKYSAEYRDNLAKYVDEEFDKDSWSHFDVDSETKLDKSIVVINDNLYVDVKLIRGDIEGYAKFMEEAELSNDEILDIVRFNEPKDAIVSIKNVKKPSSNFFMKTVKEINPKWRLGESKYLPLDDVLRLFGCDIDEIKREVSGFHGNSFFRKKSVFGFNMGFDFFNDNENNQFELYLQAGLTYGEKKGFFGWGDAYLGSKSDLDKGKINFGAGLGYVLFDSFGLKLGAINQETSANKKGIKFIAGLNYQTSFLLFGVGIT